MGRVVPHAAAKPCAYFAYCGMMRSFRWARMYVAPALQRLLLPLTLQSASPASRRAVNATMYETNAGTIPASCPPGLVAVQTELRLKFSAEPIHPEVNMSTWGMSAVFERNVES